MHYKLKSKQTADPNVNKQLSCPIPNSNFEFWPFLQSYFGLCQLHCGWKSSKIVFFSPFRWGGQWMKTLFFGQESLNPRMAFGGHSGWKPFKKSHFLVQKITKVDEKLLYNVSLWIVEINSVFVPKLHFTQEKVIKIPKIQFSY